MISTKILSKDYIKKISKKNKVNEVYVEKSILAFSLLQALKMTGLNFIFKGGTSLMLLFDRPYRLSTDVDIIVEPDTDIDYFIEKSADIFPFRDKKEVKRVNSTSIIKRHFYFYYEPILNNSDEAQSVVLDVVFEHNCYKSLVEKPIRTSFIPNDDPLMVLVPNADSIIADKLTAFAPNTCGVKYILEKEEDDKVVNKVTEVAKQFYDVSCLFEKVTDFEAILETYNKVVEIEIKYRGGTLTKEMCLLDSIKCCLSLISNGMFYKEDFTHIKEGLEKLNNFIYGEKMSAKELLERACNVFLLSCGLLSEINILENDDNEYEINTKFKKLKSVKSISESSYKKITRGFKLIEKYLNSL